MGGGGEMMFPTFLSIISVFPNCARLGHPTITTGNRSATDGGLVGQQMDAA